MSLLEAYSDLMESVTWRSRMGVDQYNQPIYSDSAIDIIWFDDVQMIRNGKDEEQLQMAYIQTTALVQHGDAIVRGGFIWPVVGIGKTPTFGREQFRIANLGQRMI